MQLLKLTTTAATYRVGRTQQLRSRRAQLVFTKPSWTAACEHAKQPLPRHCCAASAPEQPSTAPEDGFEGLTAEEDWVVPGGYEDSLSSNTELGRAVRSACDELDTLSQMESQTLAQADELLKKLGLKSSIMQQPGGESDTPTTQP